MGLLRFSGIRLLTISIPGMLLASILLYQYIGFPALFFHLDDYRSWFIQDRAIIWMMFFLELLYHHLDSDGIYSSAENNGPIAFIIPN